MTRRPDYPAAHSMDTAWFAVDRDGHVARFETGEAGAVPTDAYLGEDAPPVEDLPVLGEAVRVPPLPAWAHEQEHVTHTGYGAVIFHLRDASLLAVEIAAGVATRVPSVGTEAVRVEAPDADLLARVHRAGDCLACAYDLSDELGDRSAAARGLYEYEHLAENWAAGPYRLNAKPSSPARLEDLPADVREHVVRFDGRFEAAPLVHPMTLWRCESWQAAWIDLDGRTVRPVPGREKDYDEEAAELASSDDDLVFDPPPRPRPPRPPAPPRKPWWKLW
jgi:hypothetical protein